jgi:hypothetical protein
MSSSVGSAVTSTLPRPAPEPATPTSQAHARRVELHVMAVRSHLDSHHVTLDAATPPRAGMPGRSVTERERAARHRPRHIPLGSSASTAPWSITPHHHRHVDLGAPRPARHPATTTPRIHPRPFTSARAAMSVSPNRSRVVTGCGVGRRGAWLLDWSEGGQAAVSGQRRHRFSPPMGMWLSRSGSEVGSSLVKSPRMPREPGRPRRPGHRPQVVRQPRHRSRRSRRRPLSKLPRSRSMSSGADLSIRRRPRRPFSETTWTDRPRTPILEHMFDSRSGRGAVNTLAQGTDNPATRCRVSPLLARRPGWTVSEHPSGMVIWRSPSGRHYLRHPSRPSGGVGGGCRDAPARP